MYSKIQTQMLSIQKQKNLRYEVYNQQQNKWYPQKCIPKSVYQKCKNAHFEATLYLSRSEFTCSQNHNHQVFMCK